LTDIITQAAFSNIFTRGRLHVKQYIYRYRFNGIFTEAEFSGIRGLRRYFGTRARTRFGAARG